MLLPIIRHLTIKTLFLVSLILSELTASITTSFTLVECKQCVLFGQVLEVKRILIGGPLISCWFIIVNTFVSVLIAAYVLKRRLLYKTSQLKLTSVSPNHETLAFITISNILSLSLVLIGWYRFCNSFKFLRCDLTSLFDLMDWKAYTPKYSDCGGSYMFYTIAQLCLLWSTVSWIILFVMQRRNHGFILR